MHRTVGMTTTTGCSPAQRWCCPTVPTINPGDNPVRADVKILIVVSGDIAEIDGAHVAGLSKNENKAKHSDIRSAEFNLASGQELECEIQLKFRSTYGSPE